MCSSYKGTMLSKASIFYFSLTILVYIISPASVQALINVTEPIDFHFLPEVNDDPTYGKPGDINIGALAEVYDYSDKPGERCKVGIYYYYLPAETTESIAFAVELVNRMPNLLPNLTLGYYVRGVCINSPNIALATSLPFLPRTERICNGSVCSIQRSASLDSQWRSHNVIGVVPGGKDQITKMISSLYSIAKLPIVGATEISDDFSNKENHPYFFRIIPPARYMIRAMLKFMSMYQLTYISILYQNGYESNYKVMEELAGEYGVCIATSQHVFRHSNHKMIITHLLKYPRARTVVLFLTPEYYRKVLRAARPLGVEGQFIYICSEVVIGYTGYYYMGKSWDPSIGTFVFNFHYNYVNDFYYYLSNQTLGNTKNPWFYYAWQYLFQCYVHEGKCKQEGNVLKSLHYRTTSEPNLRVDAVLTLAHAAHNLLSERCPDARGEEARRCITGELLREYLKKTTFEGFNDVIKFNEFQENEGKFTINQMVYDYNKYPFSERVLHKHMNLKQIATYYTSTDTISFLNEPITWSHLKTLERIVPWTNSSPFPIEVPESICSGPCAIGEYKIEKEVPCCWECRKCRDNERLLEGNATCEACPSLQWPDPDSNFTLCIDIPPTYPKLDELIPIVLTSFAVFALIVTSFITICYIRHRHERVIKASSTELSAIQLVAIFLGYLTVILFQTPPTQAMCTVIYALFCISFALLYGPLLIKTIRIVRIFNSGKKNERPRFISPQSQIIFSAFFIAVQVAQCTMTYFLFQPGAQRTQPIWSEKLVELSCDFTLPGIASFLGYNILLVTLCSVFAFMVRNLPDNFNESKFISMCVSTTLLIWLAFVPSYFTADREYIRIFLLSTALIFNHSVALGLLFASKIYIAKFLTSDSGNKKS